MIRTLYGQLKTTLALAPATVVATGTTSTIDMQGFGSLCIVLVCGVFNLASANKFVIDVEESVDGTTWTKVADADLIAVEATGVHRALDSSASDASTLTRFDYRGTKRYVHCLHTLTGTVSLPMSYVAVQGTNELKPPL